MFFRVIAFLVGLIAIVRGFSSYDSSQSTALLPIITGGIVMIIAIFNLLPKIKRCPSCDKKIPNKAEICRFCGKKL